MKIPLKFTFLILLIPLNILYTQERIELNSKVDKSKITIGDLITYTITITRDKDIEVKLPELGANLGQFEIRDYNANQQKKDNKIIDQIDYIISTFDIGEFEIPSVEIKYKLKNSQEAKILKTDKIKIIVESVKPSETGDIKEIKPPVEIPYNWKPIIYIASIAIATLIILSIIIYIIKRRKRLKLLLPEIKEPKRPAHEIAYERLRILTESDLLANNEYKQYYIEISEIIRQYVEGRYGIIAMELTTTDLINKMKEDSLNAEHIQMFENFLQKCDLVKFAKYIPTDSENEEIIKLAFDIVDKTKVIQIESESALEAKSDKDYGEIPIQQKSDQTMIQNNNIKE